MPDYNPHYTLTLEFREVELALGGTRKAARLFDVIRLNRALQRMEELADQIAPQERSPAVDALLESLSEFMAVNAQVDRLPETAYALDEDDACVACALCAGGLCPDHGAVAAG